MGVPSDARTRILLAFGARLDDVRVTGNVYERKGTHAIVIHEIKELKDVHLTIEDQ